DRMSPVAKKWHDDYTAGLSLMNEKDTAAWREAYEYFTRSARSFPDSYVAGQNHENRAVLLHRLGQDTAAKQEATRAREFYIPGWGGEVRKKRSIDRITALLDSVKEVYIPDARTDYFGAEVIEGNPLEVTVESTVSRALESISKAIAQSAIDVALETRLLPDESAGSMSYAITHLSVCNHRFVPGNRAELV